MKLVADNISSLKPYQPGKPIEELERELGIRESIKLASNENPLGPSPAALEAITSSARGVHIYPDAGGFALRAALADKHGVGMDELILGNGSNELLTLVARTFCGAGETAVISQYGFVAYKIVLQAANVPTAEIPTQPGFVQDLDALAAACDAQTKVLYLANPNNPTGTYAPREALERFLTQVPPHVVVVIDEAYVEYAQADDYVSAIELRGARERLVVCRTFSKAYGLAGLRVGYAVAPPELVDYMNRIREPFNTGTLGQAAALAALGDTDHLARSMRTNEASRAILERGFEALGLEWVPSQTNFLLVRMPRPAAQVYDAMLREGVIVRPLGPYGLPDWLRITMGTEAETARCVAALGKALG